MRVEGQRHPIAGGKARHILGRHVGTLGGIGHRRLVFRGLEHATQQYRFEVDLQLILLAQLPQTLPGQVGGGATHVEVEIQGCRHSRFLAVNYQFSIQGRTSISKVQLLRGWS